MTDLQEILASLAANATRSRYCFEVIVDIDDFDALMAYRTILADLYPARNPQDQQNDR